MKKFLLLIFFIFLIVPVFANDAKDTGSNNEADISDVQSEKDEKKENFTPVKINKKAYISPKREHKKLMDKTIKSLEKDKLNFQKRKEDELKLLNIEYSILEINP